MKEHVYYHWWSENNQPVYKDLRCPIIMSIATLRGVNKTIPITVIDKSDNPQDWGKFPTKLNFSIIHQPGFVCEKYSDVVAGYKHLSRIFDLVEITKDKNEKVIYVDSDVFWFRNPLPLSKESDKLCITGYNTGFFYFNSQTTNLWFDTYETYVKAAIYSEELRNVIKQHLGYDDWYVVVDEQMISYIKHKNPKLLEIIPNDEHIIGSSLKYLNPNTVKMIHFNGIMVHNKLNRDKNARGLACLIIKEFYDNMTKSLSETDLNLIYYPEELNFYRKNQFELLKDIKKLTDTKNNDQLYYLTDTCVSKFL